MKRVCAIVTGITKGIGASIAKKLLKEGHDVMGCYSSDDFAAKLFLDDVSKFNARVEVIKADLSDKNGFGTFISFLRKHSETQDVLYDWIIMNAAMTDRTSFGEVTIEDWDRILNVNLNAPFFILQGIDDLIVNNGRVIFIGAAMGIYPHAVSFSYAVSKAGLHQLAKNLVKQYAGRRITVNVVVPGFVDTPWQLEKDKDHRKRIEDKIALGRFAHSEEIADFCMAIIKNEYINGALLRIDGGYDYK